MKIKLADKTLVDYIVEIGFAKSKSEARRLIVQGAVKLNETKVTDPQAHLGEYEGQIVLIEDKAR